MTGKVRNATHGALVQVQDEQDKQDVDDNRQRGQHTLAERQRIPRPVDKDGHCQDADGCKRPTVAEMALAVEIAHSTCHRKMGRHRCHAAHDTGEHPILALQEVKDVLGTCKAQPHTSGIDDAVEILIIIPVIAQEEPQHRQFGTLLGDGSSQQSSGYRPTKGFHVNDKNPHGSQQSRNQQRHERGAHTIEECLIEHTQWLGTQ